MKQPDIKPGDHIVMAQRKSLPDWSKLNKSFGADRDFLDELADVIDSAHDHDRAAVAGKLREIVAAIPYNDDEWGYDL